MQTFLSEPTFEASAAVLDNKRLNKQLLEGRQILAALAGQTKGWVNHPATKMWAGYEPALFLYLCAVGDECTRRGIETEKNQSAIADIMIAKGWMDAVFSSSKQVDMPPWWLPGSDEQNRIILSHRASLYNKDPEHYVNYRRWAKAVDRVPLAVVCCATRRQGKPCGYYWPTHVEVK